MLDSEQGARDGNMNKMLSLPSWLLMGGGEDLSIN